LASVTSALIEMLLRATKKIPRLSLRATEGSEAISYKRL